MGKQAKPQPRRAGTKVALGALIAVVILFTFLALGSQLFGLTAPETNYGGILGHLLARALVRALGKASLALPVLGAVAALIKLSKKPPWKRYSALVLMTVGIVLVTSLVSSQTGSHLPPTNFCGWVGTLLSGGLLTLLGFGAYALPAFAFLWADFAWTGRPQQGYWCHSLRVLLAAFFLFAFLAYFAPSANWRNQVDPSFQFLLAGTFGNAVTRGLQSLLGRPGTLIVLIAGLVATIALLTPLRLPTLGALGRAIRAVFARPLRPAPSQPVGRAQLPEEARASPESKPRPGTIPGVEDTGPTTMPRTPSPGRPAPVPLRPSSVPSFDRSEFQAEFLRQLDQPGHEDRLYKDPRESELEAERLIEKLRQFGVEGRVANIVSGPMITRFEFEPAPGIKIQRIESLADDLSLALSAERIRILAPIPGRNAVGIEIPNKERRTVYLRDTLTSEEFSNEPSPLGFALGTTITGEPCCADLRKMPHILIAGTTGSGKSVCINSIISSIIYRSSYRDVRFLTIDPKQLELPVYNPIPHLLNRTTINPEDAVAELDQVVGIMEVRYGEFANLGVRDIARYNERAEAEGLERKPYIVIVIDELADLMLRAPTEIEERITRLAQMSRAVGIHLVLATQRPSVDVITGLIKANFPCRIAFQVASKTDSRTILDMNGAESLLGRGDMLFLPPGKGEPVRLHGSFVSDEAAKRIVNLWTVAYLTEVLFDKVDDPGGKAKAIVEKDAVDILIDPEKSGIRRKRQDLDEVLSEAVAEELINRPYYEPLPEARSEAASGPDRTKPPAGRELDDRFTEAARLVIRHQEASVSMLQRRLDVGWARAGRIIDQLEQAGIVGPYVGSKSRRVLVENEAELNRVLEGIGIAGHGA